MDHNTVNAVINFLYAKDHHIEYAWLYNYGNNDQPVTDIDLVLSELKRLKLIDVKPDMSGHEMYLLNVPARHAIDNLPISHKGDPYGYFLYKEGRQHAVTEEMLDLELGKLRNEFNDYPTTRQRAGEAHDWAKQGKNLARASFIIAVLSLSIVVTIELLKRYKVWPFDE